MFSHPLIALFAPCCSSQLTTFLTRAQTEVLHSSLLPYQWWIQQEDSFTCFTQQFPVAHQICLPFPPTKSDLADSHCLSRAGDLFFCGKGFPTTLVPALQLSHLVCSFRIRLSSSFLDWMDRASRNIKHRAHPSHHCCRYATLHICLYTFFKCKFILAYTMLIILGCLSPSKNGEIFDLVELYSLVPIAEHSLWCM